ncbi:MAG: ABC transporter substrate-binding protein [Betaproteobacteria bacterium]|nr:ABC transporter substrate-binding protein [Betaproteobacteria bacterium]
MKRNTWISVALLAIALTGCEAPPPAPPVTLRVGVFKEQSFLPYYVMQEQGFEKKHGLKFEESSFVGGAGAIDAMAAGALDLSPGVGTVPLLVAAERGLIPGKVVPVAANSFADPEHPLVGVIVAHTVQGWKDLEGMKIGVNTRSSVATAAVDIRLKQEGVRSYSFVEIRFPNLGLAVAGGNVAAVTSHTSASRCCAATASCSAGSSAGRRSSGWRSRRSSSAPSSAAAIRTA